MQYNNRSIGWVHQKRLWFEDIVLTALANFPQFEVRLNNNLFGNFDDK